MNPLTALALGFSGWIIALGLNRPAVSAALIAVALIVAVAHTRNISVVVAVAALSLPVAVSMTLVHAPYGQHRVAPLMTSDGLALAGELTLRFAALMACLLAAMTFVRIPELVKALQVSPFGARVAYIVGAALQFLPQGQLAVAKARDANRLAGRRITLRSSIRHVVLPVMAALLTQAAARGQALETAGFDHPGTRTVLRPTPDSTFQRVTRVAVPLVCVAVVLWI